MARAGATAISALIVALAVVAARQQARCEDALELLEERAFRAAVDRVAPSVVRIETVGGSEEPGKLAFGSAPTTGLVIDREGYVVSSATAFAGHPESILVQLPDGSRRPATLVATDRSRMIVLLKIDATQPLPVPEIVPEDEVRVGQWAIAVGRAFPAGRPNMSVGIVSAVNRVWGKAIQTDAAVSPNNYGGPLVDIRGRLLGLLVPLSPEAQTELAGVEWYDSGIGFAVPGWHLQRVLPRLKQGEDLYPGLMGISIRGGELATSEPVIAARHPNSPARAAGLMPGDRILEIDGRKIDRASQVKESLSRHYAGETVRLAVSRGDQRIQRELRLVARLEPYERPFLGVLPLRVPARSDQRAAGVAVRYVYPAGPAAQAAIRPGDVLAALDGEAIDDSEELRRRIADRQPGDEVKLAVRRADESLELKLRLGRLPEDLPPGELPPASRVQGPASRGQDSALFTQHSSLITLKIPEFENEARAYIPEGYDRAVGHGLLVWLPGPGKPDWDALVARWKPHCDQRGVILLVPQPAQPEGWQVQEITLVRKLIEQVKSSHTLDPARVVVGGQASGGRLAYLVAFSSAETVRAVAAVDAPLTGRPPENDPLRPLAFYLAWAAKAKNVQLIEASVGQLRRMKYPVSVKPLGSEPRDLGADELAELARWIDMLDRI